MAISFLTEGLIRRIQTNFQAEGTPAVEIRGLLAKAVDHTRDLAIGFLPEKLYQKGILAALRALSAQTRKLSKVTCIFRCEGATPVAFKNKRTALHLYRIVQEAVQNATKHARAKKIIISCASRNETFEIHVKDDGQGLLPGFESAPGMGLNIIKYHARLIGAKVVFSNQAGGCTTTCMIPLKMLQGPKPAKHIQRIAYEGAPISSRTPAPLPCQTTRTRG